MATKKKKKDPFYWTRDNNKNLKKLKKLWPKASRETILKAFPGKNWDTIQRAATRYHLKRNVETKPKPQGYWLGNNGEHFKKLKKLWPRASKEMILAAFPGKNWDTIQRAATRYHLERRKEDKVKETDWGTDEIRILEKLYPVKSRGEICKALPKRTWHGIRTKAIRLSIVRIVKHGWREEMHMAMERGFKASQNLALSTEDREALKHKIVTAVNDIAVKHDLKLKKWSAIEKRASELGFTWGISEEDAQKQLASRENLWVSEILLAYLTEKRSDKDLVTHFGQPISEITRQLPAKIGKYELVSYRTSKKKTVFYYHERTHADGAVQPRTHRFIRPKNDDGSVSDNSLLVRFPESDWREIRVIPLAELYYGSESLCNMEKFVRYLKLADQEYHYFIINGAFFHNPGGQAEDRVDFLMDRREEMQQLLSPIAHKILWAHQGCTERKIEKSLGFDPLEDVCRELGIPYFRRPIMAEVLWGEQHYSFYCIHGTTEARYRGSQMNSPRHLLEFLEHVHFLVTSHAKAGKENVIPRSIRNRVDGRIDRKDQHIVLTSGFRLYKGSEEERKGHPIPSTGSCALIMFPNGNVSYSA